MFIFRWEKNIAKRLQAFTILHYHWSFVRVTLQEIVSHATPFGVTQKDSNFISWYLSWLLYLGWFKYNLPRSKLNHRFPNNTTGRMTINHPKIIHYCTSNNNSILWSVNPKTGFAETWTILHFNWVSLSSAWSQRWRCLKRYSNVLIADPLPLLFNFLFQDVILTIGTNSTKIFENKKIMSHLSE